MSSPTPQTEFSYIQNYAFVNDTVQKEELWINFSYKISFILVTSPKHLTHLYLIQYTTY